MMKDRMIHKQMICGISRRHSLPLAAVLVLMGACCAWAQNNPSSAAASGNQNSTLVRNQRISYKAREQKIDDLVRKGVQFELKKDFDKAIDQYFSAKKLADEILKDVSVPSFKSRSENCAAKISNAYYHWAKDIYEDALKSASEADYDSAIEKCRKAIEIYPASKEKLEKVIERYTLMKDGAQFEKKANEGKTSPEEIRERRVLLRQGEAFYKTGQWDKARAKFEELIVLDPYNETAIDYIRRINYRMMDTGEQRFGLMLNARNAQAVWQMVTPLIDLNNTDSRSAENNISKVSHNDRIVNKLKDIIIDKISFEEVSIATAIRYLRQCSKEKDPEKIGVNFVLRGKINEPLKADGDSAESGGNAAARNDKEDNEVVPLTMMLDNISLETVIKYICKQANLKYRIDDNAVVIASKDVPLDDVQTKVYPVEKSAITLREGQSVEDFLKEKGVAFEAGASAVYKDYIGRLIMTNTPKEHQTLETILADMSKVDPQVLIQTKFVEVRLNDLEELGFKYQLSRNNENVAYMKESSKKLVALASGESFTINKNINVYGTEFGNPYPGWLNRETTVKPNTTYTNSSGKTQYYAKAPFSESASQYTIGSTELVRTFSTATTLDNATDNGKAVDFTMWNQNGYKLNAQIYALDQADSAEVLSCPRVTTMHDTTATIQLITEKYFPTDWDEAEYTVMGNNIPVFTGSVPNLDDETQLGISLEVTPIVDSDNEMIYVLMRPLIRSFLGWDDYSYNTNVNVNNGNTTEQKEVPNTMIMPIIQQRTVDTSATCSDNGTIVLGGLIRDEVAVVEDKYPVLGDLPLIGRFFQSKGRSAQKYNLLIFLSCRLVNPDGSPLREREDRGLPPFKY